MVKTMTRRALATRWFAGFVTALVLVAGVASAAVWLRGAGSAVGAEGGPAMAIRMQLSDPGDPRAGGEWIELQSFEWGMVQSGGSPTGRLVSASEFVVTKSQDAASPLLAGACCNAADPFPEVTIQVCRGSCETGVVYLQYTLKKAYITSWSTSGSSAGQSLPTESISFNYEEIRWEYTKQGPPNSGGLMCPGYDLKNCTKG